MEKKNVNPRDYETSNWSAAKRVKGLGKIDYPDLKGMKVMIVIPNDFYRKKLMALGPGYIATSMNRCNIDVELMDCSIFFYDDIEIAKILIQSKAKIFAMGALYPQFKEVERICNIIRAVVPDATIILGGSLPSPIPEFALRQTGADIITIGEAERTIPFLMSALAGEGDLKNVKGISYMKDGVYYSNGKPELPFTVDRDEVGWPNLDIYPVEHYIRSPKFHPFEQSDRILPIVTGRGCPYSCNFCYRVTAYRIRPTNEILDEMEFLKDKYNLNGFYIVDDLLMLSKKKITEFCEGIIERKMDIKYNCSGRVNVVTPEIIKLLKDSGCNSIFYGVESGNDEILKTMSKKTNLEQVYSAIKLTREAGIYCEYGIMFGQPGESQETLNDSVKLIKDNAYGEYAAKKIFGCVPFPGTGLYEWCKVTGRIKDDKDFYDKFIAQDWALDQIPINMLEIPIEEANKMFRKANNELNDYYLQHVSDDWVKFYGGDVEGMKKAKHKKGSLSHIAHRTESSANTMDASGRSN